MTKRRVLISGGEGRLATALHAEAAEYGFEVLLVPRREMDVRDMAQVEAVLDRHRPDVVIHAAAALPGRSEDALIQVNVVGTSNMVTACRKRSMKLVYISTDYVYPMSREHHHEEDPLLPSTSYGWSKLGGECAVHTYPRSLIIRGALCPRPYPHPVAYTDVVRNPLYQDEAAARILKIIDVEGVVNIGAAQPRSLYEFAQQSRSDATPAHSPESYQPKVLVLSINKLQALT